MKNIIQHCAFDRMVLSRPVRFAFEIGLLLWLGMWSLCAVNLPAPSPKPSDISEEDWSRLFWGEPQVIMAHVVTRDGESWYDICGWDPRPENKGIGFDRAFVRVVDGVVTVLWRFEPFGDNAPAWMQLGLSLPDATEMAKQRIEKWIQIDGIDEMKRLNHRIYYESPPPVKISPFNMYDKYFPEEIEARKQLGLLPKDYVPPLSSEEREYVETLARRKYVPAR